MLALTFTLVLYVKDVPAAAFSVKAADADTEITVWVDSENAKVPYAQF
jgi:hypothetical protein